LRPIGDVTEINYLQDYHDYLKILVEGLEKKKRWAREIFRLWDRILFPHSKSKYGSSKKTDEESREDDLRRALEAGDELSSEETEDEGEGGSNVPDGGDGPGSERDDDEEQPELADEE
jgi:hypothetical protein